MLDLCFLKVLLPNVVRAKHTHGDMQGSGIILICLPPQESNVLIGPRRRLSQVIPVIGTPLEHVIPLCLEGKHHKDLNSNNCLTLMESSAFIMSHLCALSSAATK